MKVYKIRDSKTGLYSTGGTKPKWSKRGKVWVSLGALKSHLTLYRTGWARLHKKIPSTWIVEEFSNEGSSTIPAAELVKEEQCK